MRIVIDLDGTICPVKQADQSYAELEPLPGAAERIKELRANGHYIIIATARNMATCDGNMGKVMKNIGLITLEWLKNFDIEYDEIYFGKPNAEVYIDDRAIRFTAWETVDETYLSEVARQR